MALMKLCRCGEEFPAVAGVTRCDDCTALANARRDARRGTSKQRGYTQTYRRNRALLVSALNAACEVCGKRDDLTADHIIPVSEPGSSDEMWNLRVLCGDCNSSRGNKSDAEWLNTNKIGRA